MPAKSRQNLYAGVNAHLQTLLPMSDSTSPSIWPAFHAEFINNMTNQLNDLLPENYIARSEQSLQIKTLDFQFGNHLTSKPRPDTSIYQHNRDYRATQVQEATLTLSPPALEVVLDMLDWDDFLASVQIHLMEDHRLLGHALTRIELLSPSNKPFGGAYEAYLKSRKIALKTGTALVEIDFFHETPTPLLAILDHPAYPERETFPYNITISTPRQERIKTQLYTASVDESLPNQLPIPLLGDEYLIFDLNPVYEETFYRGRWGSYINYAEPLAPQVLATYRPDDQVKLETLRQKILADHFREESYYE